MKGVGKYAVLGMEAGMGCLGGAVDSGGAGMAVCTGQTGGAGVRWGPRFALIKSGSGENIGETASGGEEKV